MPQHWPNCIETVHHDRAERVTDEYGPQIWQYWQPVTTALFITCRFSPHIHCSRFHHAVQILEGKGVHRRDFRKYFCHLPIDHWNCLEQNQAEFSRRCGAENLLWGLLLLKIYEVEWVNEDIFGVFRNNFRCWDWFFIQKMVFMKTHVW